MFLVCDNRLGDLNWMEIFYFMVDITSHLNTLNKNLQGKGSTALQMLEDVLVFARDAQKGTLSQGGEVRELRSVTDCSVSLSASYVTFAFRVNCPL